MKALAVRLTLRQFVIASGIAALAVFGFGFGWLQNDDTSRRVTRAPAAPTAWSPPQPVAEDLTAAAKLLSAKQPFGVPAVVPVSSPQLAGLAAGASAGTAAALQWRVGGILVTGTTRQLVVLVRQPPQSVERSELRNIGETLPDGSVVQSVDASSVTIDRQGMIVTLRMFAKN